MADIAGATKLLEQFKSLVLSGNTEGAKQVSTQLKLKCTQFPANTSASSPTAQKELMLTRDMLEHCVIFAVQLKDTTMFDRNFAQLQPFYTDLRGALPPSQQEFHILSLNLLHLLTQNRIAEFHVEIELLSEEAQANMYIKHAVQLEQQLMEGLYSKVLASASSTPTPHSAWFMELLANTVRDEMASCCASAYDRLLLTDAAKMLRFTTQQDLLKYAAKCGWQTDAQYIRFQDTGKAVEKPNMDVFHNTLMYARELDRII